MATQYLINIKLHWNIKTIYIGKQKILLNDYIIKQREYSNYIETLE